MKKFINSILFKLSNLFKKKSNPKMKNVINEIENKLKQTLDTKIKIAVYGRSGAGKSSLVKKLTTSSKEIKISPTGDTTKNPDTHEYSSEIIFVDMPGYGTEEFPLNTFFERFPVAEYDLFIWLFDNKILESDIAFSKELAVNNRKCIYVRSFHDNIWQENKTTLELENEIVESVKKQLNSPNIELLFVSSRTNYGMEKLSEKIASSLNGSKKDKWYRTAKAYSKEFLDEKKTKCEKLVVLYAGLSAANVLNPVPALDVLIDLGFMFKLFNELKSNFGIDEDVKSNIELIAPTLAPIANNIVEYATKEGLKKLLQKYAGRKVISEGSKWVPVLGQVIAGSISFGITYYAGKEYLDDCYKIAEAYLEQNIKI